ncbi:Ataxin-10 domain-containing protein [Plasmodiophora brassicae]
MVLDDLAASPSSASSAMSNFVKSFQDRMDMRECFPPGEVDTALRRLLEYIRHRQPDDIGTARALSCIKLLTRCRSELDSLVDQQTVSMIFDLALRSPLPTSSCQDSVLNQAIRVLINICIIRQNDVMPVIHAQRAHVALLDLIARLDLSPSTDEVLFSLCRLLFYMTLDGDVQRELRDNMNAVSLLADVFANRTSVCEPGLLATAASPVCSEMCSALAELLHVLFALGSSRQCQADCQPVWKRITPSLLTLLMADGNDLLQLPHSQLVELPRTKHFALMLDIINIFFCFDPPSMGPLFETEVVHRILSILDIQARFNTSNVEDALVPVLTVLELLGAANDGVARTAKRFVFGEEWADNTDLKYECKSDDDKDFPPGDVPLKAILRTHITTFNPSLKRAVSEFLFTICGKQPGEYIRLVGFGNAIGLLAEMQLPGFEVPMQSI